ncbi:MAG TPA: cupin domain-containing protein [Crinalium sp.]|jgi:quercetin dioxygenase-like cupin family protein
MITTAAKPIGFTTQLHEHIEYVEDGVCRKIITKDEKRQAVLVCLKAGTHLSQHTSGHDGFITVIEGQGVFFLDDQEITLAPGVFIAMPTNVVHAITAIANLAFLKEVDRHEGCQEHSRSKGDRSSLEQQEG